MSIKYLGWNLFLRKEWQGVVSSALWIEKEKNIEYKEIADKWGIIK